MSKIKIMKNSVEVIDAVLSHIGIRPANLAQNIGVSSQNIYDIRKGKQNITNKIADAIVKVYPEINKKFLLGLEENLIQDEFREYDIASAIKKIEAISEVTLSAVSELLAKSNGGSSTSILRSLEALVNERVNKQE